MPEATTTCPFCNAVVHVPAANSSARSVCPRCGESFSARVDGSIAKPSRDLIDVEVHRHRQARRTNAILSVRRTLLLGLILGGLGILAGMGISYYQRHLHSDRPASQIDTAKPVPPMEMPGLGFMPEGTDSVIALQVRPLLEAWPAATGKNANSLLREFGAPLALSAGLDRAVGVGLDNIDQLVIGLKLKDVSRLSETVLVVHARQSFSLDDLAHRSKAKTIEKNGRKFHQVSVATFPLPIYWWSPNDRVLIAALDPEMLEKIPVEGRVGLGHLSPRIAETAHRLTSDTYFWAVLDSERWDELTGVLFRLQKRDDLVVSTAKPLAEVRTVTLGLRVETEPILTAWFDLKSEKIASETRLRLVEKFKDESGHVAIGGAGESIMIRMPATSEAIQDAWRKVQPKKK